MYHSRIGDSNIYFFPLSLFLSLFLSFSPFKLFVISLQSREFSVNLYLARIVFLFILFVAIQRMIAADVVLS